MRLVEEGPSLHGLNPGVLCPQQYREVQGHGYQRTGVARGGGLFWDSNSFSSEVPRVLACGVHINSVSLKDFYFPPNLV